jgi:hypothetical protein
MKDYDRKNIWARSGNQCSFPGCGVELVPEKQANRVIGEEAHIKGEKPSSPRYDPNQSHEERDGYGNRILLCPTHHTEVDSDPQTWTVQALLDMKAVHEKQMVSNRQYPQIIDDLQELMQKYVPSDDYLDPVIPEIAEVAGDVRIVRVDASKEHGINTGIKVAKGQRLVLFARGLISYDSGHHFATPEGIICNEFGLPLLAQDTEGRTAPVVWPHDQAYVTDGDRPGRIGSLFGWIGDYDPQNAFFIGTKRQITVSADGTLHLAVNDAAGTYSDNDGEYRVDVRVVPIED